MKRFHFSPKHLTALVLSLVILLSSFPAFALNSGGSAKTPETPDAQEPDVPFSFTLEEGDLTFSELKTAVLDPADIPDVISPALCAERGHVNRLYAQEPDDYTVMFQNRDGSKTTYVFSKPVKSGRSSLSASSLTAAAEDAFSVSSLGLEYKSTSSLRALDRLDKECLDGKIYYYNVGYAEITKTAGRLDSAGTEITEDVREWSRGKVIPGDRLSAPSGQAVNEEAPGSYVLMYTASEMAGIVNLKNFYTMSYLKNNYQTPMLTSANTNTLKTPAFRWVLQYCNTYRYLIKSMVNVYASSQYLLKYNSAFTSVSISTGNSSYGEWIIDAEEDDDEIMYFYLRPAMSGGSGKGLNNNLGFSNVTTGSCNDYCGWELLNKRDIAVSVSELNPFFAAAGENLNASLKTVPANAELCTVWECANTSILNYDDEDEYYYISAPGTYVVNYHDYYSGVGTDPIDPPELQIVPSDSFDDSKETYMIRPYVSSTPSSNTNLLTMSKTNSSTTNDLSAIPLYNGNGTSYSAKWTDKSQTFTFTRTGSCRYKIAATLCEEQYDAPDFWIEKPEEISWENYYDYCVAQYDASNHTGYTLVSQDGLPNWLGSSGSQTVSKTSSQVWRLIPCGTVGNTDYQKYNIVYIDSNKNVKALKHSGSTVIADNYSTSDSCKWIIYKVGINVPLIKQTRTNYCGAASVISVLFGARIYSGNENLHTLQYNFVNSPFVVFYGYFESEGFYYYHIHECVNNFIDYSSNTNLEYKMLAVQPSDYTTAKNKILNSIENGFMPFFRTETGYAPYNATTAGHFININGYDTVSNTVIMGNCTYNDNLFGIYAVSDDALLSNIGLFYYAE